MCQFCCFMLYSHYKRGAVTQTSRPNQRTALKTVSFGKAASIVKQKKDEILSRWVDIVQKELPGARNQPSLIIFNQIPQLLDQINELLHTHPISKPKLEVVTEISKGHGVQRAFLPQYCIGQVIREYVLLKDIIFEVVESEAGNSQTLKEIILNTIMLGITEASREYSRIDDLGKERFIATLTHDLRNPITVLKVSAQLILKLPDNVEAIQKLASRILDSSTRVEEMIRDLLDTFQIRAGQRLPIELSFCHLRDVAKKTIDELSTIYGGRFVLNAAEDIKGYWSVEGLTRAIENLCTNAIKYGASCSQITITLRTENHEVHISVHNSGKALNDEEQARLFSPFYRSQSAQTSGKKGWGLGLTLVRGMAEAHGGRVHVESSDSKGTIFTISLPKDSRPFVFSLQKLSVNETSSIPSV